MAIKLSSALFCLILSPLAFAQSESAVLETQKVLTDQNQRQQAIQSPDAKKAAEYAAQITGGGANQEEIYKISSEIIGSMKTMTPEQMEEYLKNAAQNPEAFANSLSPEIQKKIKELAERTPAAQQKNP